MGWEMRGGGGPYYFRCRWVDGRPACQYVGKGPAARLAADADRVERLERQAATAAWGAEFAGAEAANDSVAALAGECGLLARAHLVVGGNYRHGGEWRRRHGGDR
jgi:hypothetical protein